jgi:hypothetical protein
MDLDVWKFFEKKFNDKGELVAAVCKDQACLKELNIKKIQQLHPAL